MNSCMMYSYMFQHLITTSARPLGSTSWHPPWALPEVREVHSSGVPWECSHPGEAFKLATRAVWRQLNSPVSFTRVACGAQFSLALDSSGTVWSWGTGDGGVLGLGGRSAREPARVWSDVRCKLVACGSYHSFAVREDGQLFSWGRFEGGQLGLRDEVINAHVEATSFFIFLLLVRSGTWKIPSCADPMRWRCRP